VSSASAAPTAHRRRYLRAALDELTAGVRGGVRRPTLQLADRTLSLEAWEWDILAEWSDAAPPSGDAAWKSLVVEALALQSRFQSDLAQLAVAVESDEDVTLLHEDLHLDTVIAFKILAELQRETGRMVVTGGMDQAKRLTQFRRRLTECLSAAGKALGEDAIKQAEGIAGSSASTQGPVERIRLIPDKAPGRERDKEREKEQALFDLEEQLLRREQARESRPEPAPAAAEPIVAPRTGNSIGIRLALVGILIVAVGFLVVRNVSGKPPSPVAQGLDRSSFDAASIREVVSRPPSLFIQVDADMWNVLPKAERVALIEQIGQKADAAGYTGAALRTQKGPIVGQWLKASGARLVAPGT